MDRLTVSLDDYVKYILKKWKLMIVITVVFAMLFAVSARLLGEKIVIPPSEEYLELKEQAASIGDYIDNAPLMEIDSTNVQEIIIYLSNVSDIKALKNYVDSGEVWKEFEEENASYYFLDIVTWTDGNSEQSAEIKLQHFDEETCASMAKYMLGKLQSYDKSAELQMGTPHVSTDKSIAEVQSWYKNRRKAIEGQLEHAAAGYVIETKMPVAAVVGVLTGGLAALVILFVGFILKKES